MLNKVVVHFLDGRVSKGVTLDFVPNKESFHLSDATDERKVAKIATKELKAVFFVKTFAGDPAYAAVAPSGDLIKAPGRKLRVTFLDGEVVHGTAAAYTPGREGFFLIPADPRDNNERIYVFAHATRGVETLKPSVAS